MSALVRVTEACGDHMHEACGLICTGILHVVYQCLTKSNASRLEKVFIEHKKIFHLLGHSIVHNQLQKQAGYRT